MAPDYNIPKNRPFGTGSSYSIHLGRNCRAEGKIVLALQQALLAARRYAEASEQPESQETAGRMLAKLECKRQLE